MPSIGTGENRHGHPGDEYAFGAAPESPDAGPGKKPNPGRHARSYLLRGVTVVEFHGTIDLSNILDVQAHTDAATTRSDVRVVMDLMSVEFLDCSTLGLLCRARRRALERGGSLALVCVPPWHLRILKAAGLHPLFEPLATLDDALEDGESPVIFFAVLQEGRWPPGPACLFPPVEGMTWGVVPAW
ncbi:STAS domain-containing protein [Streptomyces sp. NBC_01261]|uniref:STAS domain-containing protein n=1 Tax=Streptomyces sp. NBC_01261 TaxID=2903802 RepID=UPI002E34C3AB|nr:STAS domain-containing protein [Streptomyces sp. NBC_01261]